MYKRNAEKKRLKLIQYVPRKWDEFKRNNNKLKVMDQVI